MTEEHLTALLKAADAKSDKEGWHEPSDARHVTLHVSASGTALTVSRVRGLRREGDLLHARTAHGDTYVVQLADVFACAVEGEPKTGRKAGFV